MPWSTKHWTLEQIHQKRLRSRRRYNKRNRLVLNEKRKQFHYSHLEQEKSYYFKRTYGITFEQYESLCKAQNSNCKICGKKKKLVVDHDHKTGKIRGLLCRRCNSGIGLLGDTAIALECALYYLRRQ